MKAVMKIADLESKLSTVLTANEVTPEIIALEEEVTDVLEMIEQALWPVRARISQTLQPEDYTIADSDYNDYAADKMKAARQALKALSEL